MKRIGILSINLQVFSPNYGSTLQSFALWKTLADLGFDAEIVDYDCVGRRHLNAKEPFRIFRRWCRPVRNPLWWQYFLNRRTGIRKWIAALPLPVRWAIYLAAVFAGLVFGAYGPGYNAGLFTYMRY